MHNQKKSISGIIATLLLLSISFFAVAGFQIWFMDYSSYLNIKNEENNFIEFSNTRIEAIVGESLYFNNGFKNLTVKEIKVGSQSCVINEVFSSGIHGINISNCTFSSNNKNLEVSIITDLGIISRHIFYRENIFESENQEENQEIWLDPEIEHLWNGQIVTLGTITNDR